jgi:nitroreductase
MEFLELAEIRYSVRAYKSDPVPDDVLQQVLNAARLAPTADNRQPFQLIVIHTAERRKELRRIYDRGWFVQGPLVICVCAIPEGAWVRHDGMNYSVVDATIVMDHLILAATSLGLGTCWVGAFDVGMAREVLGLPDGVDPVVFTPLGYPDEEPGYKRRKDLAELVRYEHW